MSATKNNFKALVVDDERLARKELILMLKEFENINVVGEADDVPSAIEAINKLNPNVIFLDIQMPGESGFDLLNKIDTEAKIIFVTAFDEHAIHAFEINALDYLLKPINPERLKLSIERLELDSEDAGNQNKKLNYDDYLLLNLNNHIKFLSISSIISITSAGDYSNILLDKNKKGLTLKSMKEWEKRLPEKHFCRIHRSTIINMNYIERIEEWFNNSYRVYLKNIKDPMVMSRRYASKLKNKLG